jgi:indolepyruvate ferredoxin oxidoreductase beta subunit
MKNIKYDIILAGVGGQGVLSLAAIIATAAAEAGLEVRQSEVHGMAQRGGAVLSHLRISSEPIFSDLIPRGTADMVLSMEPMESLRYTDFLSPKGVLVTASETFVNIPVYPELEPLLARIKALPGSRIVDAKALAQQAGSPRAQNMVLVGAASNSLPMDQEVMLRAIGSIFGRKGDEVVALNRKAFALGRDA